MARYIGLIALGILLGFVSLEAGPLGLVLSLVAAIGAFLLSPRATRARSGGVLLASAATTASVLLGRVVLIDARDPAVSLAPGTQETFAVAVVLALLGLGAAIFGSRQGSPTHSG